MSQENAIAADVLTSQDGPELEPQVNAEALDPAGEQASEEVDPAAVAKEGETEETKHKRLGGWQRKIAKTEQERDFWRDEALRNRPTQTEQPKPQPGSQRPELPKLSEFEGTIEEYDKAVAEYPDKLRAFYDGERTREESQRSEQTAKASLQERLAALPELEQMKTVAKTFSTGLVDYLQAESAKLTNGHEVLKEALLDPDTVKQLREMERLNDGQGIRMELQIISRSLRLAQRQSAGNSTPAIPKPAPPEPVGGRTGRVDNGTELRDDLPAEEWSKRFMKRMEKNG